MIRAAALLLVVVGIAGACTPGGALCSKKQECDDERQPDDTRVCETSYQAGIDALHENSEEECRTLADAQMAFDACRASLDCADFVEPDLNGLCADEREAYEDAVAEAAGECASTD